MMQTDVLSAHLNASGLAYSGRTRCKGVMVIGTATAGTLTVWDTTVAPTTATYARSGTTVTITSSAHGLSTGQQIGIDYAAGTGGTATNGNYIITKVDANTFTLTDINSGSITAGAACSYAVSDVSRNSPWLFTLDTSAVTAGANVLPLTFPGEGMLCHTGIYMTMSNLTSVSVFYG